MPATTELEKAFLSQGLGDKVAFLEERGASFDPNRLPELLEESFRRFGPGRRVAFLEERGASFDPNRLPELLEEWFRRFGPGDKVAFLEERGASFDPNRLPELLEETFRRFGPDDRVAFLVERMLEYLEAERRYAEAWTLARDAYHRLVPIDRYKGSGLIGVFYDLLREETRHEGCASQDQSVLGSVDKKLNLLSCSGNRLALGISYSFRLWLSSCLSTDPDPNIVWIEVRKFSSEFRIQRDILTYWSQYFSAKFSGRWTASEVADFNKDDSIAIKSFDKIFGRFMTTGIYDWTGPEDCDLDYEAARYLGICHLEEMLTGIHGDDRGASSI